MYGRLGAFSLSCLVESRFIKAESEHSELVEDRPSTYTVPAMLIN